MPSYYEFTCKAAKFQVGNVVCERGDTIVCTESDPRLPILRQSRRAFIEKAIPQATTAPFLPPASLPGNSSNGTGEGKGESGKPLAFLTPPQLAALSEAGFSTPEEILGATLEDLG